MHCGPTPVMPEGLDWLLPDWPSPPQVRAAVTTRQAPAAVATGPAGFNVGCNTDDEPARVALQRDALVAVLGLPSAPCWLQQVHGTSVVDAVDAHAMSQADGLVSHRPGEVLAIQTADCLPVLFCSRDGQHIGAAHAGWRGLAAGVLEATIAAMNCAPSELLAWLGPCVGQASYEVDAVVRDAFVGRDADAKAAFTPMRPGHWLASLEALARQRLSAAGVTEIHGGDFDTFADHRFHSWRRDGQAAGRFASLIWRAGT